MTNICQASISGNVVDKTVSFNLPTEASEMVDKMQSIATLDRERKCALLRSEMKPENLGNKWMLRPSLTQRVSCQPLKKPEFLLWQHTWPKRQKPMSGPCVEFRTPLQKAGTSKSYSYHQKWTKSKTLSQRGEQETLLDSGATLKSYPCITTLKKYPRIRIFSVPNHTYVVWKPSRKEFNLGCIHVERAAMGDW